MSSRKELLASSTSPFSKVTLSIVSQGVLPAHTHTGPRKGQGDIRDRDIGTERERDRETPGDRAT